MKKDNVADLKKGSEQEVIEAHSTPPPAKTKRQLRAEEQHRLKQEQYREKKLDSLYRKLRLGTMQLIGSMKKLPWCARFEVSWEIIWKLQNKKYNELGDWIGDPEDEHKAPWCVRAANFLFFWRREVAESVEEYKEIDLSGKIEDIVDKDKS